MDQVLQSIAAILAALFAAIATWTSTRGWRARRRAREARSAFDLLDRLRAEQSSQTNDDAVNSDQALADLIVRTEEAARIATFDFARLVRSSGLSGGVITLLIAYGIMFPSVALINRPLESSAGTEIAFWLLIVVGVSLFATGALAWWLKYRIIERMRAAGINIPTFRQELAEVRQGIRIWYERRQASRTSRS